MRYLVPAVMAMASVAFAGVPAGQPSTQTARAGDEILVCGKLFHTGTRIVLPTDPGGYNAHGAEGKPGTRPSGEGAVGVPTTQPEVLEIRGPDVTMEVLKDTVDQFVLHYDVCGISKECFRVLNRRGLAIHFMCDLDGTLYQTLDLKNVAYHATIANTRSIGVEIAHMGALSNNQSPVTMGGWYEYDPRLRWTKIVIPARFGDGGILTRNFVGRPSRPEMVRGFVQGSEWRQWDYTPEQYAALVRLAATLCTVFPKIQADVPRQKSALGPPGLSPEVEDLEQVSEEVMKEAKVIAWKPGDPTTRASALASEDEPGAVIMHTLTKEQFAAYQGILGHFHVQLNKPDPGPAFQWMPFITKVRAAMSPEARAANIKARGRPTGTVGISRSVGSLPTSRPAMPTTRP